MSQYTPPLRDMRFVMHEVLDATGTLKALPPYVATRIATVLCGGDVEEGAQADEATLMALERKHFCELLGQAKTQEHIMGMLQTGRPVRN